MHSRNVVLLVAILFLGCRDSMPHIDTLFSDVSIPFSIDTDVRETGRLELMRTIGAPQGPLAFGSIGNIAVSAEGILAIYDGMGCTITLYDLRYEQWIDRFGGCGAGPGEFQSVNGLTFIQDSILVYDSRLASIIWLDQAGREHRRIRLDDTSAYIVRMEAIGNDRVALQLALPPKLAGSDDPYDHHLVRVVNPRTGEVVGHAVTDPTISQNNRSNLFRSTPICARPAQMDSSFVVALNQWAFEGLVLDGGDLKPIVRFLTPVEWIGPRVDPQAERGGVLPQSGGTSLACADSIILLKHNRMNRDGRQSSIVGGLMEARTYDGRVVGRWSFGRSDSSYFGTIAAAYDHSFFFVTNRTFEYPMIHEFRVTTSENFAEGDGRD